MPRRRRSPARTRPHSARPVRPSTTRGRAPRPLSRASGEAWPLPSTASASATPSAPCHGVDVTGRHEHGVPARGGPVPRNVGGDDRAARRHAFEQHHAEGLAVQRRGAQHGRARQARRDLLVAEHSQPANPVRLGIPASLPVPSRSVAGDPQDRRALHGREGVEHHTEPFARPWRPRKSTAGRHSSSRTGRAAAKRSTSTPLNSTSNSPPPERRPVSLAASETATLTCSRRPTSSANGFSTGTHRLTPAR